VVGFNIASRGEVPEINCEREEIIIIIIIIIAVPLHTMEALGGRGGIAPTHSRPRH
jgi:hypothetical protein